MRSLLPWTLGVALALTAGAVELDESPAKAGEWGYRPADGTEPALNPPGFSWRPCDGAASYTLEIAKDEAFADVVCRQEDIPWNAFCPSMPLPAGTLYWRYAAADDAGQRTPWSQVRSFTVAADALVFPKPTPAQLVERMPAGHPRLFFRPEDLERYRELAQGALAERWKNAVARADALLAKPPDTSEPPLYPEGITRKSGEWKKIWWGNRNRVIAVADGAATLGFVYWLSGEEKYGQAARDLLVAMAEWDPNGSTSRSYNDEAAMPALYMASRAYTWAYPALSEADRAAVVAMMRVRGEQAFSCLRHHLWRPYNSHSNRLWHFLGELAIAFYDDIPEAQTWLDYAMTICYTAYPVWGDEDGGWHEGTGYWTSYTGRFMYWAYVMQSAFGIDIFQRPFYHRTGYYGMYNLPPGSDRCGFGDQATSSKGIANLMAVLAAGAQNPHWQWYAEATGGSLGGGYLGFIYAARGVNVAAQPPTDLPASACFRGTGRAILNTNLLDAADNVQILFKSSPFGTQSHGYNANNAFLLNLRGQRVLLRSGKRDVYGSPHHRDWMWHTQSDNAILVNGEGQIRHSAAACGRITAFETTPAVDFVVGEAGDAYEHLDRWTRRIVFFKPDAVLIHDVLEAPEPSRFQYMLHAPGAFELGTNSVTWAGDPGRIEVRFLEPDALALSQTDQFDPPPADWAKYNLGEWHLTAETTQDEKHVEFLTIILIDNAPVEIERDAGRLALGLPGGPAQVWPAPDALRVTMDGFERTIE
ncbi:MAG: DUF4962 domain-containing protein [Candidatus Hydrogenedentes bacterium]|nr:DUF4962 domain-containing protein [Candidatus Hydrogenedentota bacterium]